MLLSIEYFLTRAPFFKSKAVLLEENYALHKAYVVSLCQRVDFARPRQHASFNTANGPRMTRKARSIWVQSTNLSVRRFRRHREPNIGQCTPPLQRGVEDSSLETSEKKLIVHRPVLALSELDSHESESPHITTKTWDSIPRVKFPTNLIR